MFWLLGWPLGIECEGLSEDFVTMRRTIATAVLLLVCLSLVAEAQATNIGAIPEVMPLCEVIANAPKYDGQTIVVRGQYRMVIHGSILFEPGCSKTDVNLRDAPGYKVDKRTESTMRSLAKKDQFQPIGVLLRGTFHVAGQEQCFGQICAAYEIEISELMTAWPITSRNDGAGGLPNDVHSHQ